MSAPQRFIKILFHKLGYEVTRYSSSPLGKSGFADIRKLIHLTNPTIVLDVGANIGQTIVRFKDFLPGSKIHAFEPSPSTFQLLKARVGSRNDVFINQLGVGSACETKLLHENSSRDMSSFLRLGRGGWGKEIDEVVVHVTTLDRYCAEKNVPHINVLKIDTQGYDFEVLKGARNLMTRNLIQLVFMEVIFGEEMYQGVPPFDEVFRFLTDMNFSLVSFYEFHYRNNLASWTDALFINDAFAVTH